MIAFFLLGTTFDLAYAELKHLVTRYHGTIISDDSAARLVTVDLPDEDTILALAQAGGGIMKAFTERQRLSAAKLEILPEQIAEIFTQKNKEHSKISFGTVCFGWEKPEDFEADIKRALDGKGVKSRFVRTYTQGVAPALSTHHETYEAACIFQNKEYVIAETVFAQDIDAWTERDRTKPYRNPKAGMLPPKVARMMLNIGVGKNRHTDVFVYDPFCGSGTILLEAMEMGILAGGGDIVKETVAGAQKNMNWYAALHEHITQTPVIALADATTAQIPKSEQLLTIVTEPFLGRTPKNWRDIPNTMKGLEKLYLGCFKNWSRTLPDGASIVFIFPRFATPRGEYPTIGLIDRLSSFGYTLEEGPYQYARPSAVVKRDIVRLSFHRS
jgi:tRNA G10  N-methylase Trm11